MKKPTARLKSGEAGLKHWGNDTRNVELLQEWTGRMDIFLCDCACVVTQYGI